MLQALESFVSQLAGWMWGAPLLILLFGTHIFLTFQLRGIQFRTLPLAFKIVFSKSDQDGDISHFSTLMTALAATVGIGNIVGVATAITLGGPGAIFWMWLTALFGMSTKYSEALLDVAAAKRMSEAVIKMVALPTQDGSTHQLQASVQHDIVQEMQISHKEMKTQMQQMVSQVENMLVEHKTGTLMKPAATLYNQSQGPII